MSYKSFKSEFDEVYNYLIAACKDPVSFFDPHRDVSYASEDDFRWKDKDVSTGVIIEYIGDDFVVKVPKGVVEIGSRDYDGKYDPDGGYGCFENCIVTAVILPNSLKIIGRVSFWDCDKLISIDIPDSVISIGSLAFAGCKSLESINIPDSVKSIGKDAFWDSGLKSITCPKDLDLSEVTIPDGCVVYRR